jgi:hypothetical protein
MYMMMLYAGSAMLIVGNVGLVYFVSGWGRSFT